MRHQRTVMLILGVGLLGCTAVLLPRATAYAQAQERELPPITYVCPMPQDEVFETEPGRCPICGMDLIPVRIDTAFSCPDHPAVITDKPGICPIDRRRELVQVTVNVHWECASNPGQHFTEPGLCGNGQARREIKELRVHGDHNPRYGGLFFMAGDRWHHLEGTYPKPGVFRLYFYDNFTQPISAQGVTGRVALIDQSFKEVASFPLSRSNDGETMEAQIKGGELPIHLAAFVRFDAKSPEQRFDFPFAELSQAPVKPAVTTQAPRRPAAPKPVPTQDAAQTAPAAPAAQPAPAAAAVQPAAPPAQPTPAPVPAPQQAAAPAAQPAPAPAPTQPTPAQTAPAPAPAPPATAAPAASAPASPFSQSQLTADATLMSRTDAAALAENLPDSPPELLALLKVRNNEVRTAIDDGQYGFVYNPAMISKDIALALEPLVNQVPDSRRGQAEDAVRRLVLSAWYLDYYGDMGNGEKLRETYKDFAAAVADIEEAYGANR